MNSSDTSNAFSIRPTTSTTILPLVGNWLWLGRVFWLLTLGLSLLVLIPAVKADYTWFHTPCTVDTCSADGILEQNLIQQFGISLEAYAIYKIGFGLFGMLVFTSIAILLFWRRSDDGMALLVSLMLLTFGSVSSANVESISDPNWRWLSSILLIESATFMAAFAFMFPNGRFVPSWTRWSVPALTLYYTLTRFIPDLSPVLKTFLQLVFFLMLALLIAAPVYRYLRVSTPVERQQTKWIIFGFSIFMTIIILGLFIPLPSIVRVLVFRMSGLIDLATVLFPVCLGFAILRYRLWDIDFIINRTLIYGLITLVLSLVFAAAFFILRAVLEALLGGQQAVLAAVVPTALVAALFNPVRQRVRSFVDQRIYGIRIPYKQSQTNPMPSPLSPLTELGDYHDLQPIGTGGMSEVFRATNPKLNRSVAIKVLAHKLSKEDEFKQRFSREMQAVAALRHSNIVQVYDSGEVEGRVYMVMEYIEGINLADYIDKSERLTLQQTSTIIRHIASALDYVHAQGLVHRDIKPSNVMLEFSDAPENRQISRAVLMDFGIAKMSDVGTRLTQTGGLVGTIDYMAPEQIQAASNVDGRADIYALGVMAYQMLTGQYLFTAQNPAARLIAHLNQPPQDPRIASPDLPKQAAEAILKALSKDPQQRFSTAGEMAAALAAGV
jgi:tRNA A-37 threonylcarbamoyl transferase component Bud32